MLPTNWTPPQNGAGPDPTGRSQSLGSEGMRVAAIQCTASRRPGGQSRGHRAAGWWPGRPTTEPSWWCSPSLLPQGAPPPCGPGPRPLDGPTVEWAAELAGRHRIRLVAGSFEDRGSGGAGTLFNTSVLVGPTGVVRAHYRKLHLFDVDVRRGGDPGIGRRVPGGVCECHRHPGRRPAAVPIGMTHLLRPPLPRALPAAVPAPGPWSSPSPPRSPPPPGRPTGRSCCGPGPSRTRSSSSPPTRSGPSHRAASRATGTR